MTPMTIDELVEGAVDRAVARQVAPLIDAVNAPRPLTYDVAAAAVAIGCSDSTVYRLVRGGVLPRVPHMGDRILIPVAAVEALVHEAVVDRG